MKLLIAVPSAGNATEPFLESLRALELPHSVTAVENSTVIGNFVPAQRELLVRRALERGADYIFMVDDDMVLPRDAIGAMLDVFIADPGTGIVGGLYYTRDGIRPMAVKGWESGETTKAWIPAFRAGEIVDADGVGLGASMISVAALRTLAQPFFATQIYVEQAAGRVRICNEDFLLCERLRAAGFGVKLHAGIRCGHYDRGSGLTLPLAWELDAFTAHDRMMVVEPGPRYALVPYEREAAVVSERHEAALIEYIFVE